MFSLDRRDSTKIVYEILVLVQSGVSKTEIVHRANLNFQLAARYISQLAAMGLIKYDGDDRRRAYWLTPKGKKVLTILSQLERELVPSHALRRALVRPPNGVEPAMRGYGEPTNPDAVSVGRRATTWFRRAIPLLIYLSGLAIGIGVGYALP
jgi:predicted transcriptional regulator